MTTLVGLRDVEITSKHQITWMTNKIGGLCTWPCSISPPTVPTCPLCHHQLALIVQLYCPLHNSHYHRTLYVFGCVNKPCWNKAESWVVYRCQSLDQSNEPTVTANHNQDEWNVGEDNWGVDADDWSTCEDDWCTDQEDWGTPTTETAESNQDCGDMTGNTEAAPFKCIEEDTIVTDLPLQQMCLNDIDEDNTNNTDMENALVIAEDLPDILNMGPVATNIDMTESIHNPEENTVKDDIKAQTVINEAETETSSVELRSYFLNVFEEASTTVEDDKHVKKLLQEYQRQEGCNVKQLAEDLSSSTSGSGETYEKTSLVHKDIMFHKFKKRINLCPEQCIRYNRGGHGLYISPAPKAVPSRCSHCHGEVVFELQLTPTLVNYLQVTGSEGVAVEFGTVLIYTCGQSCWSDSDTYRTESILVQPDPDQHLFK